jgi:1,4-dihydroxy-2-naphthoate octaprenyltransferase
LIDRYIRDAINLLIYGGSFIGLCAACITALSFELTGYTQPHFQYILLMGTATAALYCGHRVIGLKKLEHIRTSERYRVIRKYKNHIWVYCGVWIALSLWLFIPMASLELLLWLIPGGVIAGTYVVPFLPGGRRLRDLGWSKIIWIGWSWGWLTAFMPLWYFADASLLLSVIHGIERMLFIILITIPFEIRDMQVDRSEGLITLPEKLGRARTRKIALWICGMILLLSMVPSFHYFNPSYAIAMSLTSLLTIPVIRLSYATEDDYYFGGLTDGLMILALMLYGFVQIVL